MIGYYKIAIRVALVYFVFSLLYIMLSDKILLSIISDPYTLTIFQTYKGITFILLTSLILFFVINREIFKQKKYEQELRVAKEKAEKSDNLKTSFLNNMSHEIRTPLNCLMGFSELLVDKDITYEEKEHYLNIIKNNGDQLLRIINDILDISKIEVGIVDVEMVQFSLKDILNETKFFINDLLERKGKSSDIKLEINIEDEVDKVFWDKNRFNQILQNLITNAIKFTEKGKLIVSCFKNSDNFVEIHVKDTGIGIVEDKLEQIFEPFMQEETTIKRTYGGTGLGLPICKALVEILGGKIGVESTKGEGSDFFFTIPLNHS